MMASPVTVTTRSNKGNPLITASAMLAAVETLSTITPHSNG